MSNPSRIVVGAGLFGCYAALVLADKGHDVLLVEQAAEPLTRASYVNQARLHTGLHYPRSLLTAQEALRYYTRFRQTFGPAVRDFTQIYAVAAHNSKTSAGEFAAFVDRLGVASTEVDVDRWFVPGTVERAFAVEEPSFDAGILRDLMLQRLSEVPAIQQRFGVALEGGQIEADGVLVRLSDGSAVRTDGVVLATYAATNALREIFGLTPLPMMFELTEVILGRVDARLAGVGFTVMDGPFWSLMPFGHTEDVTLTSVGLTPLRRCGGQPRFDCQHRRPECRPARLRDCTTCGVRPAAATEHQVRQMSMFLKEAAAFTPTKSLLTVKAVLTSTEVDDARPTVIAKDAHANVWTVLSGKVSTLFDLDKGLQ